MVGLDELEELATNVLAIVRERDVEGRSVAGDPGPMAFPGKKDAVFDAEGRKDAPASEQTYLAGSKREVVGELDLVVVEDMKVEHTTILLRKVHIAIRRRSRSCQLFARPNAKPDGTPINADKRAIANWGRDLPGRCGRIQ